MGEPLVKPPHFLFPLAFGHQWARTDNENGLDFPPRLQFSQNQSSFNGLADADTIGDQQTRTVRADEFQYRAKLVRDEVNPCRVERIQGR